MSTIPLGSPIGSFSGTAETNPGITGTGGTGDTGGNGPGSTTPDSGASSSGSGSNSGYNSSSESAQKQAADTCGGSGGCGGGGCNTGATGDCCTYRGQLNLSMQKAFAPYTNSCSSCGGSGVQGGTPSSGDSGGGGGNGGSGSGSSSTPSLLSLSYIFDSKTTGPPAAGHILFDAEASVTLAVYASVPWVWIDPDEVDPMTGEHKRYSGVVVPTSWPSAISYSTVHVVSMSNVDMNGVSAAPLLDTLTSGSIFGMDDTTTTGAFVRFNYDSLLSDYNNVTNFSVIYASSSIPFVDGDVVTLVASTGVILNATAGTVLTACPACAGTGLEGSAGGIPGLIVAVFNGSAGWAGTTNYDIYGIVRS